MVVINLLFTKRVKFFFFVNFDLSIALKEFSSLIPSMFLIYGYTKNLKHAADEIGFPGNPNIAFDFPLIFANKIGFPGLIATLLK